MWSPGWGWLVRLARRFGAVCAGLMMAVMTAATLSWGLGRSALWVDEGASAVAIQRAWPDLWTLGRGAETPMLPYYVLLKAFSEAAQLVVPTLSAHPEVLLRLPSVLVSVLAGWALVAWLSRIARPGPALASGAMLLLTAGFSRYGQEARPYAAVLFLAVISTILWSVLVNDPRRRWLAAYALAVAALVALHAVSAGLVVAHLVAAVVCLEPGRRWAVLLRTLVCAGVGLVLASPVVLLTARHGIGPGRASPDLTGAYLFQAFVRLFTGEDRRVLGVGVVLLLAVVGLTRMRSPQYRFIARLAACWALIPVAGLGLLLLIYPNLRSERYLLFVIPAWAILAGLGVATLAELGRVAVASHRFGAVLALAVAVVLIAGTAVTQGPTLRQIRAPDGHGEDLRPALAAADRAENAGLKIVVSSGRGGVLVGAYRPEIGDRVLNLRIQRSYARVWPFVRPEAELERSLTQPRLILLQRYGQQPGCRGLRPMTGDRIERCMPAVLRTLGYRVERTETTGRGWTFAVLRRETVPAEPRTGSGRSVSVSQTLDPGSSPGSAQAV